jgi:hypothetical protein
MKKNFLDKLACKKLVGKHVKLSAWDWTNKCYGDFSGVVTNVSVTCGNESVTNVEISISLEGFNMPFIVNDWEFKKKVKITKQ